VQIYYESRLAKLDINQAEIDKLNQDVEKVVEDEEDVSARENAKSKWAELAKLVGAQPRLEQVARDLVAHFETRTSAIEGKAMIVAMSRDICVSLFHEIIALRPEWEGSKIIKDGKEVGYNPEDGAIASS
jgi:type I restriction enzyme R subunit